MRKGSLPRIGVIYRETAWSVLMEAGYSAFEIGEIIDSGDLGRVESVMKIAPMLEVVCRKFAESMPKQVEVPNHFFWIALFSETPKEDLEELATVTKDLIYRGELNKYRVVFGILEALHDRWVRKNAKEFFNTDKKSRQCKYMPFPLIGMEMAFEYLNYADEVLNALDWSIDESIMRRLYLAMQDEYRVRYGLFTDDELVNYIATANYRALSSDIKRQLKDNRQLAAWMVYS
ncbi:hypothetical protein IJG22_01175 [Candidatus Saccharibacteria bacterium]|nr:hypothetical protein [Candidatus Saccharibacteria bacterium]